MWQDMLGWWGWQTRDPYERGTHVLPTWKWAGEDGEVWGLTCTEPTSDLEVFNTSFFFFKQRIFIQSLQVWATVLNQTCDTHILCLHNITLVNINQCCKRNQLMVLDILRKADKERKRGVPKAGTNGTAPSLTADSLSTSFWKSLGCHSPFLHLLTCLVLWLPVRYVL